MRAFDRPMPAVRRHLVHHSTAESLSIFSGRKWNEIEPSDLRKAWDAYGFFNSEEFTYFLPAAIRCSEIDFEQSHLAVIEIIFCLANENCVSAQSAVRNSLSIEELGVLLCWLEKLSFRNLGYLPPLKIKYSIDLIAGLIRERNPQ